MRKNRFIAEKLNIYIDAIKPRSEILYDAMNTLYYSPRRYKTSKGFFKAALSLAFIMVIGFTALFGILSLRAGAPPNEEPTASYKLIDTGRKICEYEDFSLAAKSVILPQGDISSNYFEYYDRNNNKALVYGAEIQAVTEAGTEYIYIYADKSKGLKDFVSFRYLPSAMYGDKEVMQDEKYEGGEFYTAAYFSDRDCDYYIIIISPSAYRGEGYIEELLGLN